MVEHIDPSVPNLNTPADIESIDPDLKDCYHPSISGFNERTRYTHDKSYCVFNLSRRAGRAELKAQSLSKCDIMRRVLGDFYINFPSSTIVLSFKDGQAIVFMCIDRAKDDYYVDFGTGLGLERGEDMVATMNDLCIMGGCKGYVIFSLDGWIPSRNYEDSVEWFCVPWTLARTLGPLDSDRTVELEEFLLSTDKDSDMILSDGSEDGTE